MTRTEFYNLSLNILLFKRPLFSILFYATLIFILILSIHNIKIKKEAYKHIFEHTKWPVIIARYPFYREFVISDILFLTPIWGGVQLIPPITLLIFLIVFNKFTFFLFIISVFVWLIYLSIRGHYIDNVFRINRYEGEKSKAFFLIFLLIPPAFLFFFIGSAYDNLKKVNKRPDLLNYIYSEENMKFIKSKLTQR